MQTKHIILLLGIALTAIIVISAASAFSIKETQTMNQGMQEMHGSDAMQNMHSGNGMMQMHKQMHGNQNMQEMHEQMHEGQTEKEIAEHCSQMLEEFE